MGRGHRSSGCCNGLLGHKVRTKKGRVRSSRRRKKNAIKGRCEFGGDRSGRDKQRS